MSSTQIIHVLSGKARPFTRPGTFSAIEKHVLAGKVHVQALGLTGDEQGDHRVHGGVDKALHHYPLDHYREWSKSLGAHHLLTCPGAFGENLSTLGLTEDQVCLGDIFRCGGVLLEVSQTRQPCWKLNDRFGIADMAVRMQATAMTGWYYRVLESGYLGAGDNLVLQERPWPRWSLRRIIELLYAPALDVEGLSEFARLPLVPSWQRLVQRRLSTGTIENWTARMVGPPTEE